MQMARRIARKVDACGGRTFFVGGFVRDRLRGVENKDIDIEVHGILPEKLEKILSGLGMVTQMGASFGIFGLRGYDIDIAMPRKEEATGRGHRDFAVYVDPFLGTYKAALRRDFTMNALMQDVLTGEVVDHFHGIEDMQNGILRHVNPHTFVEDPLRVLRAAQFAARFDFAVSEETIQLAKTMDLTTLARERILGELEKALSKAERPSVFFEEMVRMGQMEDWFGELDALYRTDVWESCCKVLDEAAKYRRQVKDSLAFMFLALTYAMPSWEVRKTFLERITNENKIIKYVKNMAPLLKHPEELFENHADERETNTLFDQAQDPRALVVFAVVLARVEKKSSVGELDAFLQERLTVFDAVMRRPFVMGADLIQSGLKPGKSFAEILSYAHELRLAGVEKQEALEKTLHYAEKMNL